MKDIKYIMKKVLIFTLVGICLFYFRSCTAKAATINGINLDGTLLNTSNWWFKNGNVESVFTFVGTGAESPDENLYLNVFICTDGTTGSAWSNANDPQSFTGWGTRNSWNFNMTNVPCFVKGTTYQGHILQIIGITRTAPDGGGDVYVTLRVSLHQNSSISLNGYSISLDSPDLVSTQLDYTSALNNMTSAINNQTTAINNQTTALNNNFAAWANQANQIKADLEAAIKEDFQDSDSNEMKSWLGNFNSDTYGLTSIITAPLQTIESITSTSCPGPLQVPIPYVGGYMTLPCMTPIYQDTFGIAFGLYQTISTALIGYWVIVRIFSIVKGMKDPDDDKIEVVDL